MWGGQPTELHLKRRSHQTVLRGRESGAGKGEGRNSRERGLGVDAGSRGQAKSSAGTLNS